jgi:B9 domain-containing protein 1
MAASTRRQCDSNRALPPPAQTLVEEASARSSSVKYLPSSGERNNDKKAQLFRSSSSSTFLRSSSSNSERNDNVHSHLQLENYYRPQQQHMLDATSTTLSASKGTSLMASVQSTTSSSFFLMITGTIESAQSSTASINERLYCRYTFSYGPDWEIVHGVSMGLSQISRQGMLAGRSTNAGENRDNVIVWNFPIEISFQSTNPSGWPRLALSVYGFDFLGRDVLRGYASVLLPINPGSHTQYLKTFRPVSGSTCQQFVNWLMGTNPEYYDSKMVTKGEGRAVTRVVSEDGLVVKVNLMVTRKDFESFGYISSRRK